MISGENKSGDEGDLLAVDDHFAKLISKKNKEKVNISPEKHFSYNLINRKSRRKSREMI